MLRKLFVAFVLGTAVGVAGFFGVTQVVGGNDATPTPVVVVVTATPTTFATYYSAPSNTVVPQSVSPPPAPTPRVLTPITHYYIPYPGNGGGPTLCRDGSISNSSGPGTCSHHGGEAY